MTSSLYFWEIVTFVVFMALFLAVFFTVRSTLRRRSGGGGAGGILDRRYANGEITREEYLKIRGDITRNPDA